jgi:Zn-finger nucleic acid-binding protein
MSDTPMAAPQREPRPCGARTVRSILVMEDRLGVEIDCRSCLRVRLCRGELDKIIERSAA